MRKILQVQNTPITTYPHTANVASMLWNDPKIYPWLMNCFIKPFGWDLCGLDYEDFWFLDCPVVQCERLNRKIAVQKWGDCLSFVKDIINEDYYVYLCVMTDCISAYKQMKGPHDMMIYGYDDEKQILYIADFFNQRYSFSTTSYNEFLNAVDFSQKEYTHFWVFHDDIIMMKPCYYDNKVFFPDRVKESLADYINAEPSKFIYTRIRENTSSEMFKYLYGKDCYKILHHHIEHNLRTNELLQYWKHAFHLMSEHKFLMCERIKYMGNSGFLLDWKKYLLEYKNLFELHKLCETMYLKYAITRQQKVLNKIMVRLQGIEKIETDLLTDIIENIND